MEKQLMRQYLHWESYVATSGCTHVASPERQMNIIPGALPSIGLESSTAAKYNNTGLGLYGGVQVHNSPKVYTWYKEMKLCEVPPL